MFLLLRLPYLALEQCVKSMDLEDQFALANVSKRSLRIVNCSVKSRKYNANVVFYEGKLKVYMGRDYSGEKMYSLNLDGVDVSLIKSAISQVTKTFNLENLSLSFREGHHQLLLDVIPFVKEQNVKIGEVYVGDILALEECASPDTDQLYEFVFKECNDAKKLNLGISPTSKFYLKLNRFGPYQFDRLVLISASWVTMNHIIRWFWNCKEIELSLCTFTCREVNRFMKEWRKGSEIQFLQFLFKKTIDFTLEDALAAVPNRLVHDVKFRMGFGGRAGRWSGYIVQQEDGSEMFVCRTTSDRLEMTTKFTIDTGAAGRRG